MRKRTEDKLRSLGLIGRSESLPMAVYAMARNIHSEAGTGSPAEKLAIGEALVNRAREKGVSMMSLITRSGYFAEQSGCNPCASSRQDPTWPDIIAAQMVLDGRSQGIAAGATHYFSPKTQDALFRAGRTSKTARQVYDSWASGGDLLTWVGYVPGVDLGRQMFFRRLEKTSYGRSQNAQIFPVGQAALTQATPSHIVEAGVCRRQGFAMAAVPAVGIVALAAATWFFVHTRRTV